MAKKIKWTKTAEKNLARTVDYLIDNWPESVVAGFINHTDEILQLLCENPHVGEIQDKKREIRGFLLSRHNKLFYRLEGETLILLKIFDTRQDPKKLRFR